ncbi:hypothetical protein [Candidatus Poriferisodalis sp.]|uniref:hypothetical protein n=1 Tax=Candidatus Poriferisodalis sp. TaxID=3101277 RepID=UPI003B010A7E
MDPFIRPTARKHGISDEDMLHAYRNAFDAHEIDNMTMIIGGDRSGRPLELGIEFRGHIPEILHAMPARARFLRRRWNGRR